MNGNGWVNGDATKNVFDDVFHPSRHEGLLETAGQTLAQANDPFFFEHETETKAETKIDHVEEVKDREEEVKVEEKHAHPVPKVEEEMPKQTQTQIKIITVRTPIPGPIRRIWNASFRALQSKIASQGLGFWTMTTLFGLVGILYYMRKRDRRERELLMFLLTEKDQRIKQLLQQIALIHEIKSIVKDVVAVRKN